jgi:hypothetical protein
LPVEKSFDRNLCDFLKEKDDEAFNTDPVRPGTRIRRLQYLRFLEAELR